MTRTVAGFPMALQPEKKVKKVIDIREPFC